MSRAFASAPQILCPSCARRGKRRSRTRTTSRGGRSPASCCSTAACCMSLYELSWQPVRPSSRQEAAAQLGAAWT
eukprot:3944931-Pleurochrysis_carterae.AAC.2